mmetsp:Transcript_25652/g.35259  ORF Transcript_25652/g.35259 Transcript_25652/m.35259 type:complete len:280 (-) Transcript_25652:198-1037(-)
MPTKSFWSSTSAIWLAMSRATFTCASSVLAPRCGVHTRLGCCSSARRFSLGGSLVNTSRAAPATCPDSSARSKASSSTIPPRAQLTMRTPFLHLERVLSFKRLFVSGVIGVCTVMKSLFAHISSNSTFLIPASLKSLEDITGSYPMTSIPIVAAEEATTCPMRPQPTTPSTLPAISTPVKDFRSHLPCLTDISAAGRCLDMEVSRDMANWAVLTVFPPGVFMTIMPCFVAAATSILSTPTPALPTILIFTACFKTSGVTFVADRTTKPSYSPIILINSA